MGSFRLIKSSTSFVLTNENEDYITNKFYKEKYGDYVYGFKYSDTKNIYINGKKCDIKTVNFKIDDKKYSIDFWCDKSKTNDIILEMK